MKNSIFIIATLVIALVTSKPVLAQEATGTGGTVSYSIGQIVYTTNTGINGSVAQGVQQPYEISTTIGINETTINLEMSVYPNPTANYLTLKTDDNANLSYQLYDMQGKIIESKTVTAGSTTIKMEGLPKASYFLKVSNSEHPDSYREVKTFKVIKN